MWSRVVVVIPGATPDWPGSIPIRSQPGLGWLRGSAVDGLPPQPPWTCLAPQPPSAGVASEDVEGPELHRDPRAGVGDLGHGVLPGPLAGAAHHDQVAVAHLDDDAVGTSEPGAKVELARVAERDDRHHGVGGLAAADRVAVPGDRVAAVAVVA